MAESIVGEVMRWSPKRPDLVIAERFVIVAIAEQANRQTRKTWYRPDWDADRLAASVGLSRRHMTNVFASLAVKGIEVRVPRGVGANGKPIYAYRGAQTTFRLPWFLPDGRVAYGDGQVVAADGSREYIAEHDRRSGTEGTEKGSALADPLGPKGSRLADAFGEKGSALADDVSALADPLSGKGSALADPFPSKIPLTPPQQGVEVRAIVAAAVGTDDDDEINDIIEAVKETTDVRNLPGYLRALAGSGQLGDLAAEVRRVRRRPQIEAWERQINAHDVPRCPHDDPGGNIPRPGDGWVRCVRCRRGRAGVTHDAA